MLVFNNTEVLSAAVLQVDLSDGSVTNTAGPAIHDYGVIDAGGGWYRLWFSATPTIFNENEIYRLNLVPNYSLASSGDNVEVWYPQIHRGLGPPSPVLDPRKFPNTSD